MIDSPDPSTSTPLSEDVLSAIFANHSNSRAIELAKMQMRHSTRALVEYNPFNSTVKDFLPAKAVMLRSREAFCANGSSIGSDVFLNSREDPSTMLAGWERILCTQIPVLDIPGNHFQPFDRPYVSTPPCFDEK